MPCQLPRPGYATEEPYLTLYLLPYALLAVSKYSFVCPYTQNLQWIPEITRHRPKTPFLLVGTKSDLRDDPATIQKLSEVKQRPITVEAAEQLAIDIKAVKYVECSALTQKGLKNVFLEAVLAALEPPEPQKRGWFRVPKVSFPSLFRSESCC